MTGTTGAGATGSGATGLSPTGSGTTGSGTTGSSPTGSSPTGLSPTGSGATGSGATGPGPTGPGPTSLGATSLSATGPGPTSRGPTLPSWWEPLLSQVRAARTEDFTRLRTPTGVGRDSAVLVLLAERQPDRGPPSDHAMSADSDISSAPDVLVLQRAATMRNHAGQPAFPGGAADPGDANPAATALREAHEEVGLDPTSVTVLAELPRLWIPVSGFVVTPVLAWWHAPHEVHPRDPGEVAHVARLPVAELVDPANRLRVRHPTSGWIGPAFEVRGMLVWGFTAGVLAALLQMGGWARPWPQDRIIELPSTNAAPPAYSVASGSADPLPSPADTQSRASVQPAGDRDLGPARRGEAALRIRPLP